MTGLVIMHASGDEAPTQELCARLAGQRPICTRMGDGCERLRLGSHMSLIIVWSHHAAALGFSSALGEVCFHHSGPVFICLVDDTTLPDELDDSAYRLIDLAIDDETLRCTQRAHELIAAAARERHLAHMAERARRLRLPTGRAFGGGALAGFATSVALLGAAGATAISAAEQLTHEEVAAPGRVALAEGRVLSGMPEAPRREAWMDVQPVAPEASEVEATQRRLDAVSARIGALQEADRRAHVEHAAARAVSAPAALHQRVHEPSIAQSHPLLRMADDPEIQSIANDGFSERDLPLAATPLGLTAEMRNLKMEPVAERRGDQFAPVGRQETAMIGATRRDIAMGPPEAEDIEGFF
jgi:hypothetical protein